MAATKTNAKQWLTLFQFQQKTFLYTGAQSSGLFYSTTGIQYQCKDFHPNQWKRGKVSSSAIYFPLICEQEVTDITIEDIIFPRI